MTRQNRIRAEIFKQMSETSDTHYLRAWAKTMHRIYSAPVRERPEDRSSGNWPSRPTPPAQ